MSAGNQYTDKQILDRLLDHMVTNLHSQYSMSNPIWSTVLKRMKKDESFAVKVHTVQAMHLRAWEKLGIDALINADETFNVNLFKMYAGGKKSFQTYDILEIDDRITELENAKSAKES